LTRLSIWKSTFTRSSLRENKKGEEERERRSGEGKDDGKQASETNTETYNRNTLPLLSISTPPNSPLHLNLSLPLLKTYLKAINESNVPTTKFGTSTL